MTSWRFRGVSISQGVCDPVFGFSLEVGDDFVVPVSVSVSVFVLDSREPHSDGVRMGCVWGRDVVTNSFNPSLVSALAYLMEKLPSDQGNLLVNDLPAFCHLVSCRNGFPFHSYRISNPACSSFSKWPSTSFARMESLRGKQREATICALPSNRPASSETISKR